MSINITENYYNRKCSGGSNFWQGMGMGILGQLTGMGGYGMGGCGLGSWGMSSIFNCGFGGYGMGYGYGGYGMGCGGYGMGYGFGNAWGMNDAYVGAQVGMMGLGVIFQGLSGYISDRKAAKAEAAEAETTTTTKSDADYKKEAEAIIDKTTSPKNYKENVDNAQAEFDALSGHKTTVSNAVTQVTAAKAEITKLEGQKKEVPTAPSNGEDNVTFEAKKQQIEIDNGKIDDKIDAQKRLITSIINNINAILPDLEINEDNIDSLQALYDAAVNKAQTELTIATNERKAAIEAEVKNLKGADEAKVKAQEDANNAQSKIASFKNAYTNQKEYDSYFKLSNAKTKKSELADGKTLSTENENDVNAFKKALYDYNNCKSGKNKYCFATRLVALASGFKGNYPTLDGISSEQLKKIIDEAKTCSPNN